MQSVHGWSSSGRCRSDYHWLPSLWRCGGDDGCGDDGCDDGDDVSGGDDGGDDGDDFEEWLLGRVDILAWNQKTLTDVRGILLCIVHKHVNSVSHSVIVTQSCTSTCLERCVTSTGWSRVKYNVDQIVSTVMHFVRKVWQTNIHGIWKLCSIVCHN